MTLKDNMEVSRNQAVEVKLPSRGSVPVSVMKESCARYREAGEWINHLVAPN